MTMPEVKTFIGYALVAVIVIGMIDNTSGSIEETDRELLMTNFPYGRGVDNNVQLSKILFIPQRMCNPKRNSELINSLLGLPKNMNNAGKK